LNAADGTPRVISKLCNAALVIGNSQSADIITSDTVMRAINDSMLG
jgi:type II secretory pathway predicted ATPase ExeA